ncbi:MAG: 2,3-diphosphoglycerate-dependent phosphoglycerate mutase [Deltaproteobacteria bacterium]|nr:2,3-diphosphoglycerate-dependent phosphoglycerate mutase [Deltaproteobacteria bacterium]
MTYTLVLLRHGESTWNRENLFTGWTDVALTDKGTDEARGAGELLRTEGLGFDVVHTSLLRRAITSAHLALDAMDLHWLPVKRSWRLNERHYGSLQGLDKKQTAAKYGDSQVFEWRRSYDTPPPALALSDARHPANEARYATLAPEQIPGTECLKDVVARVLPYWYDAIVADMRAGKRVLVVAHGNSLRALIKHLDGVSDAEIAELNVPTGLPLVYTLDENLRALGHRYLGDPEEAKKKAEAVAKQAGGGR